MIEFFKSHDLRTLKQTYIGPRKRKTDIQQHELQSQTDTVWCAFYANGEVCPYYLNNETVRRSDYYQMRYTYVRSGPQGFSRNACF